MRSSITVLTILATLAGAGAAHAAVAPGLVTAPATGEPSRRHSIDPFLVQTAAPLPGGGLVTAGISGKRLVLTRFRADGSLDAAFGRGGIARLTVTKARDMIGPFLGRVLPMPDGRLVVVTMGPARSRFEANEAVVSRVLRNGRLDASFGKSGSVQTGVQTTSASLQPDGKIVLTGTTGAPPRPLGPGRETAGTLEWIATRLDANGAVDSSFGTNGTTRFGLAGAGGLESAPLPGGRSAITGTHGGKVVVLALKPDGTVDPGFNGGAPLALAGPAPGGLIARPGGGLDVATRDYTTHLATVQRVRPDGSLDTAFGSGGSARIPYGDFGTTIAPAPDGSTVAYAIPYGSFGNFFERVRVTRLLPDGRPDPAWGGADGRELSPAFGGGIASRGAIHRAPFVPPLRRSGFSVSNVTARPDGGLLVAGTVAVLEYTGEGVGFMHEEIAVAAYRPDLSTDPTWGVPAKPASLSIRVSPQRARTVALLKRPRAIRVVADTSGPGLVRISVRARGQVVALANAPAFRGGAGQSLNAYLTSAGRRILARTRTPVPITVEATFRDFVRSEARRSIHARLR